MRKLTEAKQSTILTAFYDNPILSTDQIARYYTDHKCPDKWASAALTALEAAKLVEGRRRAMGLPKVWRLSKRGRESVGINRAPIPLNSGKVDHFLQLAEVWQTLRRNGTLKRWQVEPRVKFSRGVYAPDAFFAWAPPGGNLRAYLLECQRSDLTSKRWAEKWATAAAFWDSPEFRTSPFQIAPDRVIQLNIVVLSNQTPEVIRTGTRLNLGIFRTAEDFTKGVK